MGNIKNAFCFDDDDQLLEQYTMTIKSKSAQNCGAIEIDLTGPQGNAFFLLAQAHDLARNLGLDGKAIEAEMKSGDYENLVQVFDKNFGHLVTLYR